MLPLNHRGGLIEMGTATEKLIIYTMNWGGGAKGDWDFQISDLVKNPDGTDI